MTIESAIAMSCLAQRDFDFGNWGQLIVVAVVLFGGLIAQGLKKVIDSINEKKAAGFPPDRVESLGPRAGSSKPPVAKPIPPRIRRSPPAPTARPTPPPPVARPAPPRPPTPVARPRQERPATPILLDEDRPWQEVQRQTLPSGAARPGASQKKREKSPGKPVDTFDHLQPEDHLGHLDPEVHLGHLDEPVGAAEVGQKKRARRSRKKATLAVALTGDGLRRAIVMNEILGPPLALRDDTNRDPWAG